MIGVTTLDLVRKRFAVLSSRQRELSLLLVDGLTNGQIVECLAITVHTVKVHRAEADDRNKARRIGADAYFSKPVSIDELAVCLRNLGRRLRQG